VDGRRAIDDPVFCDRLMQIEGRVEAMSCHDLRLLSASVNGEEAGLAGLIVKLQGTELRHDLEGLAIDVMGEFGLLYGDSPHLRDNGRWQREYMYFLGLIIGGGTSQIQKNIIAERGLGMPRDARPGEG
jgi:alkylation response protein AidB-like acyl-CoA dehydrogenase